MLNIPILRWGTPYESLDKEEVFHFITGEPVARVSQANTGLLAIALVANWAIRPVAARHHLVEAPQEKPLAPMTGSAGDV